MPKALLLDFKDETAQIEILTGRNKVHSLIQMLFSSWGICGKLAEKQKIVVSLANNCLILAWG